MKKLILIFTTLFLIVSCNLSQYGNSSGYYFGNEFIGYNNELFDENGTVKNFTASQSTSINSIQLSWNKVKGADIYEIQRACINSKIIPENLNKDYYDSLDFKFVNYREGLNYTDFLEDKDPYTFYAYKIIAKSRFYNKENLGSIVQFGSYLTTPNDISVSKGESDQFIHITFSPTPGVEQYNIYKKEGESNKLIATVSPKPVVENGEKICKHPYVVADNEKGKELKFTVRAVGTGNSANLPNGAYSDESNLFIGYSLIPGAPSAPSDLSINNGQSSSSITGRFSPIDNADSYVILKTKKGGSEEEIYNPANSINYVDLVSDSEGKLTFTDNDVVDNTEYTYSVYGINDDGIGKATIVVAYKLSVPKSVTLSPVKEEGKLGYQLKIAPPMGWTDKDLKKSLEYEIIQTYSDGSKITNNDITPSKADTDYPFYIVAKNGEGSEIRKVEVFVKNTKTNAKTKAVSTQVYGIPDAPTSFKGSQNVWDNSLAPNGRCTGSCEGYKYNQGKACSCFGTYPIVLRWTKAATDTSTDTPADRYIITRDNKKEYEIKGKTRYDDKNVAVGKRYTYTIKAVDALGRFKNEVETEEEECWPAITTEQFLYESIRHVLKPYGFQDEHPDWAIGKVNGGIWSKIAGGFRGLGTDALGDASGEGANGKKIYYNSTMAGLGGSIQFGFDEGFTTPGYEYIHLATSEERTSGFTSKKTNKDSSDETISLNSENMNVYNVKVYYGYWSKVDSSGNADDKSTDVTFYNNNKAYLTGMYVPEGYANYVDYSEIYTQSKAFTGKYSVGCYYNTLDGGIHFEPNSILEKTISSREYSPR